MRAWCSRSRRRCVRRPSCTSASAQVVSPRTVLTIHLGAETFPSNPILDAGIRESLASRPDVPIDYFAEYLESDLFPGRTGIAGFQGLHSTGSIKAAG